MSKYAETKRSKKHEQEAKDMCLTWKFGEKENGYGHVLTGAIESKCT